MAFLLFRRKREAAREARAWQRARTSSEAERRTRVLEPREPVSAAINGRRYLTEYPYLLPKDQGEISRLDFQHFLCKQAFKCEYLAPIGKFPTSILDVGCGTGRWGHEMARQFPRAQVVGLDLEEMSSCPGGSSSSAPLNYRFESGNVLQPLPFVGESFDFVHQRLLVAAIPAQRWPEVIRELLRVTRHHGWIELVECGVDVLNLGPLTQQFLTWGLEASMSRGLDGRIVPRLGEYLREAGLHHVHEQAVDIPIGEWGGRVGIMMKENLLSAFSSLKMLYLQRGSEEDFQGLLQELPTEWETHCSSYRFYAFYGRK